MIDRAPSTTPEVLVDHGRSSAVDAAVGLMATRKAVARRSNDPVQRRGRSDTRAHLATRPDHQPPKEALEELEDLSDRQFVAKWIEIVTHEIYCEDGSLANVGRMLVAVRERYAQIKPILHCPVCVECGCKMHPGSRSIRCRACWERSQCKPRLTCAKCGCVRPPSTQGVLCRDCWREKCRMRTKRRHMCPRCGGTRKGNSSKHCRECSIEIKREHWDANRKPPRAVRGTCRVCGGLCSARAARCRTCFERRKTLPTPPLPIPRPMTTWLVSKLDTARDSLHKTPSEDLTTA